MTNHYVFAPEFCNPAAGWEKGQVEKNVQDARPRLWQQMPDFPDLAALNDWLEQHCQDLWRETAHGTLSGMSTPEQIKARRRSKTRPLSAHA
jgi:transposase